MKVFILKTIAAMCSLFPVYLLIIALGFTPTQRTATLSIGVIIVHLLWDADNWRACRENK